MTTEKAKGMRIVSLTAENVKKLKLVRITPDGDLVQITGPNSSGKSSVLDSIYYALAGTKDIPSKPIRTGQQKASIKLDLGEIIVTRTFTEGRASVLTVEAATGARFPSPQRMLDDLLGALTFDPLEFSRMEPKKQLETIRSLVKLDVDIDALDGMNKTDYEARTEVNRNIKTLEGQLAGMIFPKDTPERPLDTAALVGELESAGTHNASIETRKVKREGVAAEVTRMRESIVQLRADAEELRQQAAAKDKAVAAVAAKADELQAKLDGAEALPAPIDTAEVRSRIAAAEVKNKQVTVRQQHASVAEQLKAARAKADTLTAQIDGRAKARADAIAGAKMPVPGLTFGDGEVLLNDLPLTQASDAQRLSLSVAIAMATNPKLRVLRIKDGSLLDSKALAALAKTAEEHDYQIWIEKVDETGKVGVVMVDGEVKGAEAEAPAMAKVGEQLRVDEGAAP